eukprot:636533_1
MVLDKIDCDAAHNQKYNAQRLEYANRHRKSPALTIGSLVLWWNGEYPSTGQEKLSIKWYGPFVVLSTWNGGNNMTLQHCHHRSIYLTANIKRIKHFKARKIHQLARKQNRTD